ncbi:MAG: dipeptide/oligopeptide/nickel ABC transporter ATP-binding protein [Treponema sp.]|nr:dipeptide/oligopeptide/nickel ABC transporter ATP-binding protein [Treponema sp.]
MNESLKNEPLNSSNEFSENIIQAEHLYKKFKLEAGAFAHTDKMVYAVNDVSFAIKRGETYGLVGESGCGKTTTARMLIGMYTADSGNILYSNNNNAVNISDLKGRELKNYREKVKYVFQDPAKSLNPRMSVYSVLTTGLRYSSQWKGEKDAKERAVQIIEEVGLTADDLEKRPAEFSGGQRQRISIARALIMNPDFMICDEVVSALDVSIQAQILNLLSKIRRERNLSMLFITHDLKVACYFCDRIGVMYKGSLIEEKPAAEIYKNAENDYTKKLFAGANYKAF